METFQALLQQFEDYFVSVYENTVFQLSIFVVATFIFLAWYYLYHNVERSKLRHKILLVIGGWGTRGKSSTERLKSALLNALGYSIVSKTTGCEANLLISSKFGRLKEYLLFRPYEKATITEQDEILNLASRFNCDAFLWECMALDPEYVQILQKRWMHDDLSTITNTFPDHEDVQGPTGLDIAKTISHFIPYKSKLLTSEEQMLPVLTASAKEIKTTVQNTNWLDVGLISDDLLELFPYKEHPENVALVLNFAKEMGIRSSFALKEMAERVVPDLGSLKTYPMATMRTRRLEFSNGMSANDRVSALNNWYRLGFHQHTLEENPDVWISVIANNRRDRVSRSEMFANLLVRDMMADSYIIIGSNLTGFMGYIENEFQSLLNEIDLYNKSQPPIEIFMNICKKLRVPTSNEMIIGRLKTMLEAQNVGPLIDLLLSHWSNPDILSEELSKSKINNTSSIIKQLSKDLHTINGFHGIHSKLLENQKADKRLENDFKDFIKDFYFSKFFIIDDETASGERIINLSCDHLPPGFYHRMIGVQNIKGSGLEAVYRWQIWENCYHLIPGLKSHDIRKVKQVLTTLSTFTEFSTLCEESMKPLLEMLRDSPITQQEDTRALIMLVQEKLKKSLKEIYSELRTTKKTAWYEKIILFFEAFLDPSWAVRRKRRSAQIYQDLVDKRISSERARRELKAINQEQSGGYLYQKLLTIMARFRPNQKLEVAAKT